jgi:L-ascorbate metabolism protein UlaG (beta-lactamase superfamily)
LGSLRIAGESGTAESFHYKQESNVWIMGTRALQLAYVGGPTALLQFDGVHFLTDPTFDPAGGEYKSGPVTLRKVSGPAIRPESLGAVDYVLLSHDHHFDNLDHAGRRFLPKARNVITTEEGAQRLQGNAIGLRDWQSIELPIGNGSLRVIATPARYGPPGLNRGAVTGFVVLNPESTNRAVYVSGDTVWYEGVDEVSKRFDLGLAILHLGAARVPEVGPFHLAMSAEEAAQAARAFPNTTIVPIHFEGWAHFCEGREDIARAFQKAGISDRLVWPDAQCAVSIHF